MDTPSPAFDGAMETGKNRRDRHCAAFSNCLGQVRYMGEGGSLFEFSSRGKRYAEIVAYLCILAPKPVSNTEAGFLSVPPDAE